MKKTINAIVYNTETSRKIGRKIEKTPSIENLPAYEREMVLYRKKSGTYFLYTKGNIEKGNIQPLTYEQAYQWGSCNLTEKEFKTEFEVHPVSNRKEAICVKLPDNLIQRIKKEARMSGKKISFLVEEILQSHYDGSEAGVKK